MQYDTLTIDIDGPKAQLTLNRPDHANAMTMEMGQELTEVLKVLHSASDVRAMVLTGAGEHFCAGGDMTEFARLQSSSPSEVETATRAFLDAIGKLHQLPFPVIARIHGDAFGGGVGLALACDLRLMAEGARLGFVFPRVGLSGADAGVTYFLPRLVGQAQAAELLFLGQVLDGAMALQAGLVHRAIPLDELDQETDDLMDKLIAGPPLATRYTKEGLVNSLARSLDEELDFEARVQTACLMSSDHQEGVQAFLEKRPPSFEGR